MIFARTRTNRPALPGFARAVALSALLAAPGCGPGDRAARADQDAQEDDGAEGDDAEAEPVTIALATVEEGEIHDYLVTTSFLRAVDSADVAAEVAGAVEALEVEEAVVRRGDVLARVDFRQLGLAERKARAARDKARSARRRAEELDAKGLLSGEDLDLARFEAVQAEIGWKEAELAVQLATVRSPINGVIARRDVRLGDRVNVGKVMLSIVDPSRLEADLHLPERSLDVVAVGQRCQLSTQSAEGAMHPAEVVRISPVVDAESGTVKVVARLTTTDPGAAPALRPGQFVRARLITVTHEAAALVPKKAVLWEDGEARVFVREEGKARAVTFQPGLEDGDRVEAVAGLAPGTEVMVAGHATLRDGTPVRTEAEAVAALAAEREGRSGDEDVEEAETVVADASTDAAAGGV